MADPLNAPGTSEKPFVKRQVALSTALNVGTLFDLDWCVIVGARAGDIHFVPWNRTSQDEAELLLWLQRLAEFRASLPQQPRKDQDHAQSEQPSVSAR